MNQTVFKRAPFVITIACDVFEKQILFPLCFLLALSMVNVCMLLNGVCFLFVYVMFSY
jgi:hypothetical protein